MKFSYNEITAHNRGYYVKGLSVFNKDGKERSLNRRKSYPSFTITIGSRTDNTRIHKQVMVHRLVAYQKFGDKIYQENIQVRHKDGDRLNFLEENILIGTPSQNMMDRLKKDRVAHAKVAAQSLRKYSDVESIKSFHNNCKSYKRTMEKFNISSKGTLWHILRKR